MALIIRYLVDDVLPSEPQKPRKLCRKTSFYTMCIGELFRQGFSSPILKCLDEDQAAYVLVELHKGKYGVHLGARCMATRVLRAGYFWLSIKNDAHSFVEKYIECQKFNPFTHCHLKSCIRASHYGRSILVEWIFSILFPWIKVR